MCDKYVTIYAAMGYHGTYIHLVVTSLKNLICVFVYAHILRHPQWPLPRPCDRLWRRYPCIISLGFSTHLFCHTIIAAYACYHGRYGIAASVMKTVMVRYVKANIQILECVKRCWADAHCLQTIPLLYIAICASCMSYYMHMHLLWLSKVAESPLIKQP